MAFCKFKINSQTYWEIFTSKDIYIFKFPAIEICFIDIVSAVLKKNFWSGIEPVFRKGGTRIPCIDGREYFCIPRLF